MNDNLPPQFPEETDQDDTLEDSSEAIEDLPEWLEQIFDRHDQVYRAEEYGYDEVAFRADTAEGAVAVMLCDLRDSCEQLACKVQEEFAVTEATMARIERMIMTIRDVMRIGTYCDRTPSPKPSAQIIEGNWPGRPAEGDDPKDDGGRSE